jgi:N6-adenosine-specific RNA methylase IME4
MARPAKSYIQAVNTIAKLRADLFDERPIRLEGFLLQARTVKPIGRPTLQQWGAALQVAHAAEESAPFWIGDLWNYAEERADWRERLPQMLADIGLDVAQQTLYNYGSIARRVKEPARRAAPSHGHASQVARLDDDEQVELLEEAGEKGWSVRDLRLNIKRKHRPTIIEGQALLEGLYRVFLVDYPWTYSNRQPSSSNASDHFPPMPIEEGCKLPIAAHAAKDAVMFFWVTAPLLFYASDGKVPDAYRLLRAWDFQPKTGLVWDKVEHVFGNYVSIRHEHLIIATRGSCTPDRPTPMIDSVQTVRRGDVHSAKPEDFRKIVERLYDGPYIELFARERIEGWSCFGNDARLWVGEAEGVAS